MSLCEPHDACKQRFIFLLQRFALVVQEREYIRVRGFHLVFEPNPSNRFLQMFPSIMGTSLKMWNLVSSTKDESSGVHLVIRPPSARPRRRNRRCRSLKPWTVRRRKPRPRGDRGFSQRFSVTRWEDRGPAKTLEKCEICGMSLLGEDGLKHGFYHILYLRIS